LSFQVLAVDLMHSIGWVSESLFIRYNSQHHIINLH